MPLYEYECRKDSCGLTFESIANRGDTSNTAECPSCKSNSMKREVPSSFGFSFKSGTQNEVIDMSVGRASELGWLKQQDRENEKRKVREKSGVKLLSKLDGEYRPVINTEYKENAKGMLNQYGALSTPEKIGASDFDAKERKYKISTQKAEAI